MNKQQIYREKKRKAQCTFPLPKQGEVITDGEKMQCHVCGFWGKTLAPSHIKIHNLTADDYREEYGLNCTQPLAGEAYREWARKHFIGQGLVGKYGSVGKLLTGALSARHRPHRLQANLSNSHSHIGIKVKNTEKRMVSQRENLKKARDLTRCSMCGKEIIAQKKRNAYCYGCRPKHREEYGRQYREEHREKMRAYMKIYDKKRRG